VRVCHAFATGLFILGSGCAAAAADLYGSLKDFDEHPALGRGPGWYLRIDGGYALNTESGLTEAGYGPLANSSLEDTGVLGGGIGLYLGRNLRIDVTGDYRFEADASGTSADLIVPGRRRFGLDSVLVLANLYYDFDIGGPWRPYVGAGIGAVHHNTSAGPILGGAGRVDGASNWNFAGALMAGLSLNFGARSVPGGSVKDPVIYQEARGPFHLDLGYRFLLLGDAETGAVRDGLGVPIYSHVKVEDIYAHEFRIGLRYDIR
jgi:opacity protein-like surface antigen